MEKAIVNIEYAENNFSAWLPELLGCVSIGDSPEELKENIKEAVAGHIAVSLTEGDEIPEKFKGEYELEFHFDTQGLLKYYEGIFTKSALQRITGISQGLLSHYANGLKKPRIQQRKRIEEALHNLGKELINISL